MAVSLVVARTAINTRKPSKKPQNGGWTVAHRYKVREIAQQSGLSEATIDRVLNKRPGVRENTRAEVMQAIADLDKQRAQLRLNGRRYLIDVVMQTPQRFSDAFRTAVEPNCRPSRRPCCGLAFICGRRARPCRWSMRSGDCGAVTA
jgi:hypothetical protein